jgi:hypothetical protein
LKTTNPATVFNQYLSGFGEGDEYIQTEGTEKVVHSYYENDEFDKYLRNCAIIQKA